MSWIDFFYSAEGCWSLSWSKPMMMSIRVCLPEPEGPMRATRWKGFT